MATVTPTLTITSSDALVDTLSLSVNDSLEVLGQSQYGKKQTTGSLAVLFASGSFNTSYVFLKNLSPSDISRGTDGIVVAFGSNEELALGPGEFAFFPWDGGTDLQIKHNGTGVAPFCEFAIFEF